MAAQITQVLDRLFTFEAAVAYEEYAEAGAIVDELAAKLVTSFY